MYMNQSTAAEFAFSRRGWQTQEQPISFLVAQELANPEMISLAAGLVDYASLPAGPVAGLFADVLGDVDKARAALQYGRTEGLPALREMLYRHMAELDGIDAAAFPGRVENVIISTGSQQLLHLLTDLLVDPGDIVITARPSYFVYTGTLASAGATVRTIDMDEHGLVPASLEQLLDQIAAAGDLARVKIVYVCSYHQNPTGLTLDEQRREALLDIVRRYSREQRILLIEDAAYREITYEGSAPRSIKSFDSDNAHVALLQTFSKPFAPGLRTGYGLLPDDLTGPVTIQKSGCDFGSANLSQHVLLAAMEQGVYDQQVKQLCQVYGEKLEVMLDALREHMPGDVTWTRPRGGLYVWLTLPQEMDSAQGGALFAEQRRQGVLVVPGAYCYPPDATRTVPGNHIRLSFGAATLAQIRMGVQRLATAIGRVGQGRGEQLGSGTARASEQLI
jgi:2-aminoadipate transaminase